MLEPLAPELRAAVQRLAGDELAIRFIEDSNPDSLRTALDGAAYGVVRAVALPEQVLRDAAGVRLIHQWGTGVDGIPLEAAAEMGVAVAKCPGVNAPSVADVALGLMLSVLRRIPQTHTALKAGRWEAPQLWDQARELAGATVGLVGFGAIGQAVAQRLTGFGCDIRYWRPSGPLAAVPGNYLPLDDLIAESDVISLHMPLTEETRHFIDNKRLARMKPGAILINTARGGLVDEPALVAALKSGQIGAVGLDVFAKEPTDPGNPLLALENTVVLPHIGGRTRDNLHRMVRYWAANIRRHAAGEPIPPGDLVIQAKTKGNRGHFDDIQG